MNGGKHHTAYDMHFKIIVVGDSGVGKTNLLTCFTDGVFKDNYVATIGVDFKIKIIQLQDKRIKLQVWDTAGQERFRNITQTYYKGAEGILLAYACNEPKSFENVSTWVKQIEANSAENVCKILVATKSDLKEEREVTKEQGRALASKFGMQFFEVSAKENLNVHECFEELTRLMKQKRDDFPTPAEIEQKKQVITVKGLNKGSKKNRKCEC